MADSIVDFLFPVDKSKKQTVKNNEAYMNLDTSMGNKYYTPLSSLVDDQDKFSKFKKVIGDKTNIPRQLNNL